MDIHNTKGQVMLFVTIGLVIVIILLSVFMVQDASLQDQGTRVQSTYLDSLLDCFTYSHASSLEYVGLQGGYYDFFSSRSAFFSIGQVPYYYDDGVVRYPTISDIEAELAKASQESMLHCLRADEYYGVTFSYTEDFRVTADILENEVIFTQYIDVTVTENESTHIVDLSEHPIAIPSSIHSMHAIATFIADEHKIDDSFICISCINELAQQHELNVNIMEYNGDANTNAVLISESRGDYAPFLYQYLVYYGGNS